MLQVGNATLSSLQRSREIFEQVALVFEADGDSDEAVADARAGLLFARDLLSPHRRRMHDQGFIPAQARGVPRKLELADEGFGHIKTAAEFDAQHARESAHLTARQLN